MRLFRRLLPFSTAGGAAWFAFRHRELLWDWGTWTAQALPRAVGGNAGDVMKEARRYADVIAENGPLAVQAVKRSVLAALGRPTAEGLQSEHEIGVPVAMSVDAKEGTRAFKEKRRAVYHGR